MVTTFLEDEFEFVQELVLASVWLQKHGQPGFSVVWVDRDNEQAKKKEQVDTLNQWTKQNNVSKEPVLQRIENLKQLDLQREKK